MGAQRVGSAIGGVIFYLNLRRTFTYVTGSVGWNIHRILGGSGEGSVWASRKWRRQDLRADFVLLHLGCRFADADRRLLGSAGAVKDPHREGLLPLCWAASLRGDGRVHQWRPVRRWSVPGVGGRGFLAP